MDLVDLKESFIPRCFVERVWEKLLVDLPGVCEPLIREFYTSTTVQEDVIDCSVKGREFTTKVEDIDEVLGFGDVKHDFTHFKDKMLSIETVQSHIGWVGEGRCLNIATYPPDLRCFTYIIMFNLYPVKKITTINNARAIFLM